MGQQAFCCYCATAEYKDLAEEYTCASSAWSKLLYFRLITTIGSLRTCVPLTDPNAFHLKLVITSTRIYIACNVFVSVLVVNLNCCRFGYSPFNPFTIFLCPALRLESHIQKSKEILFHYSPFSIYFLRIGARMT